MVHVDVHGNLEEKIGHLLDAFCIRFVRLYEELHKLSSVKASVVGLSFLGPLRRA
jgi:hypothetical protein